MQSTLQILWRQWPREILMPKEKERAKARQKVTWKNTHKASTVTAKHEESADLET